MLLLKIKRSPLLRRSEPAIALWAILEGDRDADFVPNGNATEFVKEADGLAAVVVVAIGRLVNNAAVFCCRRTTR